jgi:acyl-CoA synthetase (AMP-forming)/AMP-acid ligase II
MLIHETLDRARRLYPAKVAVVDGDQRFTYAELADRVDRLAGALAASGVQPGARAGVVMHNRHEYMETYFAAERAGAVLVPLNQRLAPPEISFILQDAGATHLILDAAHLSLYEHCRDQLPDLRTVFVVDGAASGSPANATLVDYEQAIASAAPLRQPARDWQPDDMVQLYYTSGTTGRPKGVMLTQQNVMANAMHAIMNMHFNEQDTWIHATPMFHLADAWSCWTFAWVGARHVFLREFTPQAYLGLMQQERVTASILVPTMINAVINDPRVREFDVSAWRLLAFGASPMPVDRLRVAMETFPDVTFMQLYGMTETAPFATRIVYDRETVTGPPEKQRRLASCGREIPGVQVRVVREDGGEIAPGEIGEIVMRGPNIMAGYWNQPDASAETLRGGWMHSGDMATVDEDGYIYIVDRKKDMIISGGENIYSTEVENAVYQHPAVLEAAVIGIPDPHWGERVHAVVVLKEGHSLEAQELTDFCRQHIAGYKVPRSVEIVDALPKTGSGKIQKSAIRERYWQEYEAATGRRV